MAKWKPVADLNGPQSALGNPLIPVENCLVMFGGLTKVGMLWSGRTLNFV